MADRFPSLDEFDSGQTDTRDVPETGAGSSFLDRERALLGEDADEFSTPNDRNLSSTVEEGDDDLLAGGGDSYEAPSNDIGGFEDAFPSIDGTNEQVGPGGTVTGVSSFPGTSSYSAPAQVEDSEVVQQWREKRNADIERRDKISADKKATTVSEARQAIDDFYESYNDKRDKSVKQARKEADEFLANRDDTTAGGTSWERIGKLVDLSGKGVKGGAAASGKERFRELLISLRKDENAPGAKGI